MYKRKLSNIQDNAKCITWCHESTFNTLIVREPSIIDEFVHELVTNPDGTDTYCIIDPIYLLFNQKRLDKLGPAGVQHFLDSLQPKSDSLAELRSRCSDKDLVSLMKSRHLQSPAEILAWCRYMQSNIDQFNKEVQALVEAQKPTEQPSEQPLNTE